MPRQVMSLAERIIANRVIDAEGCWIWQLHINSRTGYGNVNFHGQRMLAHRASYQAFVGPIPDGLELDHLCRTRTCVNPAHLEPVTSRENSARSPLNFVGINLAKTHCKHGHPFDEANTKIRRDGARACRTCLRAVQRRYRERRMQRAAGIEAAA